MPDPTQHARVTAMSRLRVVDGYQPFGGEPPLVVAVSSSFRFGTVEGR